MLAVRHVLVVVTTVLLLSPAVTNGEAAATEDQAETYQQEDVICAELFKQYVHPSFKQDGDDVEAACQLVASRGRGNGFWRIVFAEFKECKPDSHLDHQLLDVLSRMLAKDGAARRTQERMARGDGFQQERQRPAACLSPEVVATLIERARLAEGRKIDRFIVAIVQAHDPQAKPFFMEILQTDKDPAGGHLRQIDGGRTATT